MFSHFITEKKAALTEDSIIIKLCDSYKSSISQSKYIYYLCYIPFIKPRVSVFTICVIYHSKTFEMLISLI